MIGMNQATMAIITAALPAPITVAITRAIRIPGRAKATSIARARIDRTRPFVTATANPRSTPGMTVANVERTLTSREFREPTIIWLTTSRPRKSVPSIWPSVPGGSKRLFTFTMVAECGVQTSDNKLIRTNADTSVAPITKDGSRRLRFICTPAGSTRRAFGGPEPRTLCP